MAKFTIEVEMKDRWVPHFMSMLKYMESCGNAGCSRNVTLYADGDGDFQAKFESDVEFEIVKPVKNNGGHVVYDAG